MTKRWTGFILVLAVAALGISPLPGHAHEGDHGHADLAQRLLPSVVSIYTETNVSLPEGGNGNPYSGTPFEEFFDRFFNKDNPDQEDQKNRAPRSLPWALGSGFIISGDGDIVTNVHVIDKASKVLVRLDDGTEYEANVVATDSKTDIALLKIDVSGELPAVPFGDSDVVRIGDVALAIGNPFGFGNSVTAGIISARQRDIQAGPYDQFLQTDAPINRGNSGGPLFNIDGEVIGVNTLIYSPSGGSVGIGFAVPSNVVAHVISQLKEYGRTRRGWLGVRIQPVTPEIAEGLDLPFAEGALVASVTPDSPAEAAGIQVGDTIISFNGIAIGEMRELPRAVVQTEVGLDVEVIVIRDGEELAIDVVLGELEAYEARLAGALEPGSEPDDGDQYAEDDDILLGMEIRPLVPDLAKEFGLEEDRKGLVVTRVKPDGPADRGGVQAGDILLNVGRETVETVDEVVNLLKEAQARDAQAVVLRIEREGDPSYLALEFAE